MAELTQHQAMDLAIKNAQDRIAKGEPTEADELRAKWLGVVLDRQLAILERILRAEGKLVEADEIRKVLDGKAD